MRENQNSNKRTKAGTVERFSLFKNKIKKMDSRRRERIGDSYWNPTAITNPNLCVFQLYQVMELNISFTWNSLWVAIFTNSVYPDKLGTPSTNPSRPFFPWQDPSKSDALNSTREVPGRQTSWHLGTAGKPQYRATWGSNLRLHIHCPMCWHCTTYEAVLYITENSPLWTACLRLLTKPHKSAVVPVRVHS